MQCLPPGSARPPVGVGPVSRRWPRRPVAGCDPEARPRTAGPAWARCTPASGPPACGNQRRDGVKMDAQKPKAGSDSSIGRGPLIDMLAGQCPEVMLVRGPYQVLEGSAGREHGTQVVERQHHQQAPPCPLHTHMGKGQHTVRRDSRECWNSSMLEGGNREDTSGRLSRLTYTHSDQEEQPTSSNRESCHDMMTLMATR